MGEGKTTSIMSIYRRRALEHLHVPNNKKNLIVYCLFTTYYNFDAVVYHFNLL